jgi:hypothetical protein
VAKLSNGHYLIMRDVAVVGFLRTCEADGIEMLNCARYIREWIDREQS